MDSPIIDNISSRLVDDFKVELKKNSKLKIIAASFSIYAYQLLKKELEQIDELEFIFNGQLFTKEKAPRDAREFYIPRMKNERALYGADFEIKLKNELNQQAIARECAEWIKSKVKFRSNVSGETMPTFATIENSLIETAYNPFNNFTTAELGADKGNNAFFVINKMQGQNAKALISSFNQIWTDDEKLKDVTDAVLDNITAAYKENSAEYIYFVALYNIFKEFLDDLNADFLPKEATGFKESQIWNKLYDFQRDAVVGCITKLERHNGCILADSVGLGKTFSALGVIKYYECRNLRVLVLCPKRLNDNWRTYTANYKNNSLAEDRFRYDVLYHTDVSRDSGQSNSQDLSKINWGNYDLVVIDESHNFRNGESTTHRAEENYENRYQKLMNRIIKKGVKTKVLMLSATPVNTNFKDLKNQLLIAAGGSSTNLDITLSLDKDLDDIFKQADSAYREWQSLDPESRTTSKLLNMLSFDFFELLDSVTIARSRKHIERYYSDAKLGKFPARLNPISKRPDLYADESINYNLIFTYIDKLNLSVYNPLNFVQPSAVHKYVDLESNRGKSWRNREFGRNVLMMTNLLKRIESSVHAFRLSTQNINNLISETIEKINQYEKGLQNSISFTDVEDADDDGELETVGKELKIEIGDIDYINWRNKLAEDIIVLEELLSLIKPINLDNDLKLLELLDTVEQKIKSPLNSNNKKVVIFTAFSDTAEYLYQGLKDELKTKHGLNTAIITGSSQPQTTLSGVRADFNEILTCFSPISKDRDAIYGENAPGDIDILIATDCISEGQNLQDCDFLINYDIHWNPVRIIQRFGRIDRIGSRNSAIQLVNFWPNISLDAYMNLKSRVENRMKLVNLSATGSDNPIDHEDNAELAYRKAQLEKLQSEVVDLEDVDNGVSIMDLGLNEFHLDLQELIKKYGDDLSAPSGIHSITTGNGLSPGVIYILKNVNSGVNINKQNRLHPFYLIYTSNDGDVLINHLNPKELLDKMRLVTKNKDQIDNDLVAKFNAETDNGKNMQNYTKLLTKSIQSMISVKEESDIDSLFNTGGTTALTGEINGLNDFELISFLVIK